MKPLIILLLFPTFLFCQLNPYNEIDQVYCSSDSVNWQLVMNPETGYIATGDDLRIANTIHLYSGIEDDRRYLSNYYMLKMVLGLDRARAISTIYFSKYYKAINDNGEIIMQGYGSSYLLDGFYIDND